MSVADPPFGFSGLNVFKFDLPHAPVPFIPSRDPLPSLGFNEHLPSLRLHLPVLNEFGERTFDVSPSTVGWLYSHQAYGYPMVTAQQGDKFVELPLTSCFPCRKWQGPEGITCICADDEV